MFKKEKIVTLRVLSSLIAALAFVCSAIGIFHPVIYKPIVLDRNIPFIFAQDLISAIAAVVLLIIILFGKKRLVKLDIVRTGIVSYLFYAYGQFVLGTLYNPFYFLYLAIFSLSIFYFIAAFTGIEYQTLKLDIPKPLRIVIAVYCALIPIIFAPQWILSVIESIQAHLRPEADSMFSFNVAVYIMDLSFVLPVCAIASVLIFRNKILGLILGGILSIKGFTLLAFVALGFIFQPLLFRQNMDVGNVILYSLVSIVFLVLAILFFANTKVKSRH